MNLSNSQVKLIVALIIVLGLGYRFLAPFSEETDRINNKAEELHKELDVLKKQAEVFGPKWDKEMTEKEKMMAAKLPDSINSSETLDYLLNQFEKAHSTTVHFINASHQSSVATEFKIPGQKGTISPRVSRYRLHSKMKQEMVVPYLEHMEKFTPTHNLEDLNITVPKEGEASLEMEVTVGVYLSPKEWAPKLAIAGSAEDGTNANPENWMNWFQDTPMKAEKKEERGIATKEERGPKSIRFKISNIVGDGVVVNETLYEEGDSIQGWKIIKVDGANKSVLFKSGSHTQRVKMK